MSPEQTDLRSLPKAHLHLHFVGAMRASTLRELSARYGLPTQQPRTRFGTFADFQDQYLAAVDVLRTLDDLERLVVEIVEDAATDGAVWIELAINLTNHGLLGDPDEILSFVIEVGRVASEKSGVGIGWIVEADRTVPTSVALEQAVLAVRYQGRGVVGFGLANDETAAPTDSFAEAFEVAIDGGLLSVPHAGEHGDRDSVVAALEVLGASRVEHGVRAIEDPVLVERLARDQVCLDICPTSNELLSVVDDIREHPIRALLEAGVRCSINADDPLLFGVGILSEYERCRDEVGLSVKQLALCARYSIESGGAPEALKAKARASIADWSSAHFLRRDP